MTTYKVTVVFGELKLIIPCNPDDCVRDLVEKCCIRYKKALRKAPQQGLSISHLITQKDGAILDSDDLLRDVVDDREQVIAVFEDQTDDSVLSRNKDLTNDNEFYSRHSPSKQVFAFQEFTRGSLENLDRNAIIVVNESDLIKGGGLVIRRGSESHLKIENSVLAPLPNGKASPRGETSPLPPGLLDNEAKVSNHRRWSLTAPPSPYLPKKKQMPVKSPVTEIPTQISVNGSPSSKNKLAAVPASFQRDGPSRRSAVTNAEQWINSQIEKPKYVEAVASHRTNNRSESPCYSSSNASSRSCSPESKSSCSLSEKLQFCTTTGEYYETVKLKQEIGALGIHVIPRVLQQNKLHMGLYLQAVEPQGRVGRAGLLSPGDCIIAVNGMSLLEMPFATAQDTFRQELQRKADYLLLDVVRKHCAAVLTAPDENSPEQSKSNKRSESKRRAHMKKENQTSPEASQLKSHIKSSALTASGRKVRRRVEISLVKGTEGLGFTLASRDNETNPKDRQVVVKNIQAKGVAARDGRLKAGDRIIEINDQAINELSQQQTVSLLKSVPEGSSVNLVLTRLVDVNEPEIASVQNKSNSNSPRKAAESAMADSNVVDSVSLAVPSSSLRQYLTYDIQLNDTGSAGLGVSLKASSKTTAQNLTHDLGIFIMKIIHGGAAHKDGRLKPNDQLVEVNGISLLGKTNADAMDTLKQAIIVPGPRPGFIRIRVARACKPEVVPAIDDENAVRGNFPEIIESDQIPETHEPEVQATRGGSVSDADASDVFVRETPLRQSMSEKRHNLYQDPRNTDSYKKFLEMKQAQPPRPKSVEPDARVISPSERISSPAKSHKSTSDKPVWVAGPQPQAVLQKPPPKQAQPLTVNVSQGISRRSTSLESLTASVQHYQSTGGSKPAQSQTVILPPPAQRVVVHQNDIPSSTSPPAGMSPFTRKSNLNQSFRSAVDRSAPAQINEGFEDTTRSPERHAEAPQYQSTPPYRPSQNAPSTAPTLATSNGGFKAFFRLTKSKDQSNDPADTHHRQRFYDLERQKQEKIRSDQQQMAGVPPQPQQHQRPSATSLHSLPATLMPTPQQTYQHSPEYQRLPATVSPPRHFTNQPRQPPSYFQYQQMLQQQHQQHLLQQQQQQQNLLQTAPRPSQPQNYQPPTNQIVNQRIHAPQPVYQRTAEPIYATRAQIRPPAPPLPQAMVKGYTHVGQMSNLPQPAMGVSSAQSRYPMGQPELYMSNGGASHYRPIGYVNPPQQQTQNIIYGVGQQYHAPVYSNSGTRPVYVSQPQQSSSYQQQPPVQPSPTARV